MHSSRLLLGFFLIALTTACGPRTLTPDRELYGTWVDPTHGTQMTLREDMTMDFFGREGTWHVVDNSGFLDCWSPVYCDKRLVLNGIEENDGIEFNSSELRAHPDKFKFNARGTLTMNGRSDGIQVTWPLYRQGSFPEKFVPAPFARMSAFSESFRANGFSIHGLHQGRLIVTHRETLYRFVEESGSWESIFSDDQGFNVRVSDSTILIVYRGSSPDSPTQGKFSLDGGTSWSEVPALNIQAAEGEWLNTNLSLAGDLVIMHVSRRGNVQNPDGSQSSATLEEVLWGLELTDDAAAWNQLHSFDGNEVRVDWSVEIGLIVSRVVSGESSDVELSSDGGQTWTTTTAPCAYPRFHDGGLYCFRVVSEEPYNSVINMALKTIDQIQWYELATDTWQSYPVNWENSAVFEQGLNGGVYFFRDESVWSWTTDGTESPVMSIESALPATGVKLYPDPFEVASDAIYLEHFGLWRAPL